MADGNSTQAKRCVYCDAEFTSAIARAKYCCDAHQRAHYRRTKLHGPFTCQHCGAEFYKKNTHRDLFCSRSCRTSAINKAGVGDEGLQRMRSSALLLRAARAVVRDESAALTRIGLAAKALFVEVDCSCCGERFIRRRRWQSACSFYCIQKARALSARTGGLLRRARIRGMGYDKIDPLKVFERDKWKCHICGVKTRRELRGSCEALAPELEHIVSLKDGGAHTWGNVACACRRCNGKKGATSFGQLGLGFAA